MYGGNHWGCPSCGQLEQAQQVPALYSGGRAAYAGAGPVIGFTGHGVAVGYGMQTGSMITELAASLQPPHTSRARGAGWMLTLGLACAAATIGFAFLAASGISAHAPAGSATNEAGFLAGALLFPVTGAITTLAFLAGFVTVCRRTSRHNRRVPAAVAIWQQGWFCHRCNGAFFRPGSSPGLSTGQLLSVDQFRAVQW